MGADFILILLFTLAVLLFVYVLGKQREMCRELERAYTPQPRTMTRPEARGRGEP